jgi:copper/silver efflux system protein
MAQVPVSQLATIHVRSGPSMLRNENGLLSGYVYVDVADRDVGTYVDEAKQVVREKVKVPPGYHIEWSGQYEAMERVRKRLWVVIPLTLFLILMLLYMNTKSLVKTLIVAGGAVLGGGCDLAAVDARLQHEHRRVGRI